MARPCEMLKVKGIRMMVRKAGMPSLISRHLILPTLVIIKKPTTIRAGAVTG